MRGAPYPTNRLSRYRPLTADPSPARGEGNHTPLALKKSTAPAAPGSAPCQNRAVPAPRPEHRASVARPARGDSCKSIRPLRHCRSVHIAPPAAGRCRSWCPRSTSRRRNRLAAASQTGCCPPGQSSETRRWGWSSCRRCRRAEWSPAAARVTIIDDQVLIEVPEDGPRAAGGGNREVGVLDVCLSQVGVVLAVPGAAEKLMPRQPGKLRRQPDVR